MKKTILPLVIITLLLSLMACGKNNTNDATALYDDLLSKFISGEEMFSDEGEGYGYADAAAPAYALYDIDKDGTEELFITPRKDDEWHTYSVYYIKDGVMTEPVPYHGAKEMGKGIANKLIRKYGV